MSNDQDTGVHFTLFGEQRKAILQIYKINVDWVTYCFINYFRHKDMEKKIS